MCGSVCMVEGVDGCECVVKGVCVSGWWRGCEWVCGCCVAGCEYEIDSSQKTDSSYQLYTI